MAEEDNFDDLDIYGDGTVDDYTETQEAPADAQVTTAPSSATLDNDQSQTERGSSGQDATYESHGDNQETYPQEEAESANTKQGDLPTQAISSMSGDTSQSAALPKQAPVQQGVKRKEGTTDEREIAPGATNALLVSDLHWYQDEDDVRGWCNQAGVEDEVKEITFNEHKVNGKSKG